MLTQAVLTMYVHVVYMWWWSVRMLHLGKIINSWCKHAHYCPDINVGELGKVYIATGSAVNDYSSVVIWCCIMYIYVWGWWCTCKLSTVGAGMLGMGPAVPISIYKGYLHYIWCRGMKWELTQACGQCLYTVVVGDSQRYQVRTKTIAGTSGRHTLLRYGLAQLIYAAFDVFWCRVMQRLRSYKHIELQVVIK